MNFHFALFIKHSNNVFFRNNCLGTVGRSRIYYSVFTHSHSVCSRIGGSNRSWSRVCPSEEIIRFDQSVYYSVLFGKR